MKKYKDELRTKKHKKFIFKLSLFSFAFVAVAAGLLYVLFFAKFFDIRSINISAPDSLRADISKTIDNWLNSGFWNFNRRNNILFFSADKLSSQLAKQFPKLESVKITKNLPHSLSVSSGERKPVGIWCLAVQNECFYFDKGGIAFSKTQPSSGFLIMNITDRRTDKKVELGGRVADDDWLKDITDTQDLLNKNNVNVKEFVIPVDSFDEFHAQTAGGWKIMFSTQTDIGKQINSLTSFLKEKLTPEQKKSLQYIDLRIQDRIYYK